MLPPDDVLITEAQSFCKKLALQGSWRTKATTAPPKPTTKTRIAPRIVPPSAPPTTNATASAGVTKTAEPEAIAASAVNTPTATIRWNNGRLRTPGPAVPPIAPNGATPEALAS